MPAGARARAARHPRARFFVVTGGAVGDVELHEVDLGPSRGGVVELREGVDAVLDAHAARDGDAEVTAQALGGPGGAHVAAVQGVVRERGRAVETAPAAVRLVRQRGEQEHAREPRQNLPQEGVGGSHRGLRANLARELGLAVELRLKPRGFELARARSRSTRTASNIAEGSNDGRGSKCAPRSSDRRTSSRCAAKYWGDLRLSSDENGRRLRTYLSLRAFLSGSSLRPGEPSHW